MDSSFIRTFEAAGSFPPEGLEVEVPLFAQLMLASLFLCVFAAAVDEDGIERQQVKLKMSKPSVHCMVPEIKALARRFAAVAGLLGTQLLGKWLAGAAGLLAPHSGLGATASLR